MVEGDSRDPGWDPPNNHWFRVENFLPQIDWDTARDAVFSLEGRYRQDPDHVTGYRRSRIVQTDDGQLPEPSRKVFLERFEAMWPLASSALGYDGTIKRFEQQVTASFDSDGFGPHIDAGQFSGVQAGLTYVYYLHPEPHSFTGGQLVMYYPDKRVRCIVEPLGNSIIFFRSHELHEIRTVEGPKDLRSARITVNGWVNRENRTEQTSQITATETTVVRRSPGVETVQGGGGEPTMLDTFTGGRMRLPSRSALLILQGLDGTKPLAAVFDAVGAPQSVRPKLLEFCTTLIHLGAIEVVP